MTGSVYISMRLHQQPDTKCTLSVCYARCAVDSTVRALMQARLPHMIMNSPPIRSCMLCP